MQLQATDLVQALRSTVLAITCDGEQTVWCPVGDFFGSGVGLNPFRDWWREVDRSGLMTCWWVMPQRESCRLELINLDSEPIEATLGLIAHTSWTWDERSYTSTRIGASRRASRIGERTARWTGTTSKRPAKVSMWATRWRCTMAPARGGAKATRRSLLTASFPSHFGTGTEDYYGYSYGDQGTFFESPFHSEPRWEGNNKPGFVTVTRTRGLDAFRSPSR